MFSSEGCREEGTITGNIYNESHCAVAACVGLSSHKDNPMFDCYAHSLETRGHNQNKFERSPLDNLPF